MVGDIDREFFCRLIQIILNSGYYTDIRLMEKEVVHFIGIDTGMSFVTIFVGSALPVPIIFIFNRFLITAAKLSRLKIL